MMRERNHTHNYSLCSCIYLAVQFVSSSGKRTMARGGGGEGGTLRTNYNGHSEKTVTFSFSMAFQPRLEFPIQLKHPLKSGSIFTG